MTLRARPTTKPASRSRRPGDDHRRNLYLNIGFGAVVLVAVLLFAGAAFSGWYADHLAAAATVNGVSITKDQVAQRIAIENFRINQLDAQIRAKAAAGKMAASDAQSFSSSLDQAKQQVATNAIGYEIGSELIRQLAAKRGIAITDADINAMVAEDGTVPESRHTYVITVKPEVSTGATEATDAQKQAAKDKAGKLLADLKGGKSWEDVVKASGDTAAATGNGDLYFIDKGTTSPDKAFVDAVFALAAAPAYTEVIEGSDGAFRIGRMTEISAAVPDPNFTQKISAAGVDVNAYRNVDRARISRDRIEAQLLAEVVDNASDQRKAATIIVDNNAGEAAPAGAVLARQILYSPNDAPSAAAALKADDPAWTKAKQEADDAYGKLTAGTARFVDLAQKSDDSTSAGTNGFLDFQWKDKSGSTLDPAVANAIFTPGVTAGQPLAPIKGADGWYVVQVVFVVKDVTTDSPESYVKMVHDLAAKPGTDIAKLAGDYSVDSTAAKGGDMGWIAKYQVDKDTETELFALQKGAASAATDYTAADGTSIFSRFFVVTDVQTRKPDAAQAQTLRDSAFNNWYSAVQNDPAQANVVQNQ